MGTSNISPPQKQLKKVLSALKDLFAGLAPYKALPRCVTWSYPFTTLNLGLLFCKVVPIPPNS